MTGLEFLDSTIGHVLSWPVIVVAALLIFRKPLARRIAHLHRAKVGSAEIEFLDALRETEMNVSEIKTEHTAGDLPDDNVRPDEKHENLVRATGDNPSGALLAAWARLEAAQRNLGERHGIVGRRNPIEIARHLYRQDIVNSAYLEAFEDLRRMRNLVAHGEYEPSPGESTNYIQLAQELTNATAALARDIEFRKMRPLP